LAPPLIGRVADIGLKLKPMLTIVSNESLQTVVFIVEKNQMLENAEELRIELDTVIGQAAASGSIPIRSFTARSFCLHRGIARSFELRHAP
jgi:hypothetical protein